MQCIEVEGGRTGAGYGSGSVYMAGRSYMLLQHRVAWELAWGLSIPPGMVIMHTCDNPPCVNPMHLQLGTQGDNSRDKVQKRRDHNSNVTHCPRGHEYTTDNTYRRPPRMGRVCRACNRDRMRAYDEEKRKQRRAAERARRRERDAIEE